MLKVGTDFSGIGSPEIALKNLGVNFKSMFACDYDKYAKQSYLANHNTENFYDDITTRNQKDTPYVDLYVAGFPCQAFSLAGKRQGFDDTRGTLFFDLLKYLEAKKPKYFILENVKGLLSHNKGQTMAIILDCLAKTVNSQYSFTMYEEGLNYHIYYKVLNTKDYGLPQNRERVFIVGFRDDNHTFRWPKPFKLEKKLADLLEEEVDDKYYLSDKAQKSIIENTKNLQKSKVNPDISTSLQSPGNAYGVYKGATYIRTHSLYPRSSKTGPGGSGPLNKDDGTTYCIDTGNAQAIEIKSVYGGLQKNSFKGDGKISPCLTSAMGAGGGHTPIVETSRIRKLTPLECLRLQGFPDEFYYKCKEDGLSDTQLYKQAGNSMTSDVMYYIIKEILKNGY